MDTEKNHSGKAFGGMAWGILVLKVHFQLAKWESGWI
jgi:hypothetical protein